MNDLCGRTGGTNVVVRNVAELRDAMVNIGVALHNQYVLGYYPPGDRISGKYRKIKVQLIVPPWASTITDSRAQRLLRAVAHALACRCTLQPAGLNNTQRFAGLVMPFSARICIACPGKAMLCSNVLVQDCISFTIWTGPNAAL